MPKKDLITCLQECRAKNPALYDRRLFFGLAASWFAAGVVDLTAVMMEPIKSWSFWRYALHVTPCAGFFLAGIAYSLLGIFRKLE